MTKNGGITFAQAKKLLDQKFSIFPVNITWNEEQQKFEKKPSVAWKAYQNRLPTEEELHKWFDKETHNGIGLATGKVSGVVVIDVEKEGLYEIGDLESERISRTISRGKHYFYETPEEEMGNTVKIGGKKMDFRGDGGYVVVPPSSATRDKKIYEYTWEKECPLFMLKKLPSVVDNSDWTEVKEPLKLSESTQVESGSRNDTLYRVACSLITKHGVDEAWQLVNDINRTYQPPLHEREVKTLFTSAEIFMSEKKIENEEETSVLIGLPVPWSEIKEEDNRKEWIWENYIAKGNITLLSALWKAGKTTFLRCLFLAMVEEEEFAGQPTMKAKVLILSEEARGEWSDNRSGLSDEEIKHILVWSRPIRGALGVKQWARMIDDVTKLCIEEKIDMVVIDTLTTFWPIDNENDAAQVKKALVPLYNFTENNIAVLLVHHFRKGGGDNAQASSGSGALPSFVDNIIEFTRSDSGFPNQRTLKTYGRFDGVIPEVIIKFNDLGKYETLGDPHIVSKKARIEKILSIFSESDKSLSAKDVTMLWSATTIGISLRSVQRYLRELLQKKIIFCDRNETVAGKTIPFYAQTGWKEGLNDRSSTPPLLAVVSQQDNKTVVKAVAADGQFSLASHDTTGASGEGEKKLSQEEKGKDYRSKKKVIYYE